jgi:hypothetical protein
MGNISNSRLNAAIWLRIEKERQRMAEGRVRSCDHAGDNVAFYIYVMTGDDSGYADGCCKRCNNVVRYSLDEEAINDMKKARDGRREGPFV